MTPHTTHKDQGGFALLYSLIIIMLLMIFVGTVTTTAMRALQSSSINKQSQKARYAAESGLGCALYYDRKDQRFEGGDTVVQCGGSNVNVSNNSGTYTFTIAHDNRCAHVEVDKSGSNTVIRSRGFDRSCAERDQAVERGLKSIYK